MRPPFPPLAVCLAAVCASAVSSPALAARKDTTATNAAAPAKPAAPPAGPYDGLAFRALGPALMSGRVGDLAVDPARPSRYFVAVASGGVWRTTNGGATFEPVFDKEASFSIGCVTIDPNNPYTVWVGSGENNSQRSVAFGDGVYRSDDGGSTWTNMGLRASEHIGEILVDPRDSDVVYVAAQGPLWGPGGDRGLYKTTDGGRTWKAVLTISENTGVSDLEFDPRDPDVIYASSYQRRRHVFTLINGGPESAVYKSTDAGATWTKITKGLPEVDLGRIGLAVSPADPDVVYAIVEAAEDKSGFFRSTDRGGSWTKMSGEKTTSGQYYNEIFADPRDVDRVYSMDTFLRVTEDGGRTFRNLGERFKHVDNHALWIDPRDTKHLLVGCDGGLYETFDRGATWLYKPNLPVTQFYRVQVDNSVPFYHVYGGTQDNNTIGGPSRTVNANGIVNADWFITLGGDGFQSQIDPADPNIVYSQYQYGGLVRYDRRSGEAVGIRPAEAPGEEPLRYNWDAPLILSPHASTRLYFAAQRIFRSDDRGDSWTPVSGDLTRRIDRNRLPVMGKVWGPDAVAKNASTSFYGNIVSLVESPKQQGLLYAGTDDGLLQVTEDGGKSWRKVETFPGVPDRTYVSDLAASRHDAGVVYATFDNHKNADFKPYVLRSADRGRTWASIAGDLPPGEVVYTILEDRLDPRLLFAGTERGLFVTRDGGAAWVRLRGGLPTIQVRDLVQQEREDDLVLATFGRGFYVLDDLAPLRLATPAALEREATLFPPRPALAYVPATPLGDGGKATQGEAFYSADNPPFGAVFTYHLKDGYRSLKERRQQDEKKAAEEKRAAAYPTLDALRAEALELEPEVLLTVSDAEGNVVRRLTAPASKGFHRVAWDLRFPPSTPLETTPRERDPWELPDAGPLAVPGRYRVQLAKKIDGVATDLGAAQEFEVVALSRATLPAADKAAALAFQQKVARLQRAVLGATRAADEAKTRAGTLRRVVLETPRADAALLAEARRIEAGLNDVLVALRGDQVLRARNEPTPTSIVERVQGVVDDLWRTSAAPGGRMNGEVAAAATLFEAQLATLRTLVDRDLANLQKTLDAAGAPWTPGRLPDWKPE